jgi:ABC-2 type transport system permease protein
LLFDEGVKMKQVLAITRKELQGYFGSPMALIFVGTFLAITLFSFFWVETFFARGIADVRPLFRWMPVLMILLVAALTMRQWSEEQRSGTLEVLLTLPVSPGQLVLGKFLAVLALVAVSLALTLFLPITVSLLGNLDWGPVIGGYLAAILLAGAYAAIGLFVSSRTDNQIVALISTALLCGFLYLLGSGGLADFVGQSLGDALRAIAPGSRFESIERGVVDLRDMLYYLSLSGVFLALNVFSLISKRWSQGAGTRPQRRGAALTSLLLVLNLVLVNVWAYPLRGLRLDLTSGREYTLSQATRDLLSNLQEPLLIRGYFSEKTHPLLAPLVPTIRDTLQEYKIASGGKVQLEIVDPAKDPDKEAEANQTYGIQPTPFQVAGRYESSIINSYFDILIRYGDQNEVLNFQDLIEVEAGPSGQVDVHLRNLEYDLTRSIKKVVYGFQSVDAVLAGLKEPAKLTAYVTTATLPQALADVPQTIEKVAGAIQTQAQGKFSYTLVDPDAAGSTASRQQLYELYGLQPIALSLFSGQSYYLYMVLEVDGKPQVLAPSGNWSEAEVRTAIESALKRASPGFLKVVGLWTPSEEPTQNIYGQTQQALSTWGQLRSYLAQEYELRQVDLAAGSVPPDVDVLVVVAPQGLDDKARFAVDQYLMRGGAVVVAAGNYKLSLDPYYGGLTLAPIEGGLQEMLASYGITVEQALVMDLQNEPFPVQVTRTVSGVQLQEIRALDYPFFPDIRSAGMAANHPIVSGLAELTLNWASPVQVDATKNAQREVTTLLRSSKDSWTTTDTNIQPNLEQYPQLGFPVSEVKESYPLAVAVQGSFESYFKGKASPLTGSEEEAATAVAAGTVEVSPETTRLVVLGSAAFLDDVVFQISASLMGNRYVNSLKLVQSAVSWCTEDLDLLTIRARGTTARVLKPLTERVQSLWEVANYVIALLALVTIAAIWNLRRQGERPLKLLPVDAIAQEQREVKA